MVKGGRNVENMFEKQEREGGKRRDGDEVERDEVKKKKKKKWIAEKGEGGEKICLLKGMETGKREVKVTVEELKREGR